MKIGIVTTWFERGAAYVSKQFMETLQSLGHEVYIYARGGEEFSIGDPKWDLDNVTWNSFLHSPVPTDINRTQFESWIDNNAIETIIFNEQQYWEPVIWAKEKKVYTVAYIDYYTKKTVQLFDIYDQLWCNTQRHASAFNWHSGMKYLPWGTDVKLFKPENTQNDIELVTFFHSAGMNPYRKGTDFVILSAVELIKKNINNFKLLIHIQTEILKFFPELKSEIQSLINSGHLQIINKTVSAPGLYHLGDVYVYPSRLEGIGLTIAEAMSCGLPAIVTDEGPMNEFVEPKYCRLIEVEKHEIRKDGYFWPMAYVSVEKLTLAMMDYTSDRAFLEKAKIKTREHALKNLDFDKNKLNIQTCLENIAPRESSKSNHEKLKSIDKSFTKYYFGLPTLSRFIFGLLITTKRKLFK
jgi:glycosyltransferase involved in cell wall biosynthesis